MNPSSIFPDASSLYKTMIESKEQVDIIITSPSYNLASNNEQQISTNEFLSDIESTIRDSAKILKEKGRLVIDVADWIMVDGNRFDFPDYCKNKALSFGLTFFMNYKYELEHHDTTSERHDGEWNNVNLHSSHQTVLVFTYGEQETQDSYSEVNSLSQKYQSDSPARPEPFWPLDLVTDMVRLFNLDKPGITVVDPYFGSGQIALHVLRAGGRFFGSEKSDELRLIFQQKANFEFSTEVDTLAVDINKYFRSYDKRNLYYIGIYLIDKTSLLDASGRMVAEIFVDPEFKDSIQEPYKELSKLNRSLSQILAHRNWRKEIILITDRQSGVEEHQGLKVLVSGEIYDQISFIETYKFQADEQEALNVNFEFTRYKLEEENKKSVLFITPIIIGESASGQLLSYLIQICPAYMINKPADRRRIIERVDSLLGGVFARRCAGLVNQIIQEQQRSSRAAVFARNFSHISGSHVVSNPAFRHSLAGNKLMHDFRRSLDQSYNSFISAENDLLRYIFDDIKSLEHAFSAAAKELANVRDKLGTGDVLLENTRRFHEYLQGRFDFIARAIDDLRDQPEPVWFVKDLLEGFLNQTAYLDNLVADVGLRRDDMEFFLRIGAKDLYEEYVARWAPQAKATDSVQHPLEVIWEKSNKPGVRIIPEKMVLLPGGMGSAHAFYSLLENIIRNSAKYGTLKKVIAMQEKKYKLTLQISQMSEKDGNPGYQLISIWDNYSLAVYEEAETYKQIQAKLEKNFVRNDGQAEVDDLGMMEMQACAKFLCRENEGLYPGGRPDHLISENASPDERRRFNLWTSSLEESQKIDSNNPPLVFQMAFNKTTLMACCTPKANNQTYNRKFELISWLEIISDVIDLSPFLLVLDGSQSSTDILKTLAQDQTAYPQRIVVVCTDEVQLDEWSKPLGKPRLPHRRIVCLVDKAIHENIFSASEDYDEKAAILAGYKAWLKAWKPPPPNHNSVNPADKESQQWHLWIGLQRQGTQVKEAWGKADAYFLNDNFVQLMVASFSTNDILPFKTESLDKIYAESEEEYWKDEKKAHVDLKKALVFDNHGNCFRSAQIGIEPLCKSTRFYQKLSGSVSPELFRLLSSPPQDEFSFKFFVYSLVESCLTNVLVVDERLAMTLLEGRSDGQTNENFGSDLLEHQKAGIYPVFRFRHKTHPPNDKQTGFYTQKHRERLAKIIANKISESDRSDIMAQEGVIFDANHENETEVKGESNLLTCVIDEKVEDHKRVGFGFCTGLQADVILIHEGAMDILIAEGVDWKEAEAENQKPLLKQLQALYQLAPVIIRTSGRGRKSKLLGQHLPFIEFTQVSSALLTARNKFSLVRALLGSVGRTMR